MTIKKKRKNILYPTSKKILGILVLESGKLMWQISQIYYTLSGNNCRVLQQHILRLDGKHKHDKKELESDTMF